MTWRRVVSPSADRAQQLTAPSVSLVPSGSDRLSDMVRVCPADTDTAGATFRTADLGSVGARAGPGGLAGAASVQSDEMGSWRGETTGLKEEPGQTELLLVLFANADVT